ncbi:hypothetical protein FQN60_010140 [Etheostoma spectabile]|uniref:Uncharacterized protein n=1 Tax=Etheostoma spectabile TaxID=54343 RepID=A0A5J5D893_9PERO|nr:hypothetical protein FQN60_010140 [Etheostoma spectabile]
MALRLSLRFSPGLEQEVAKGFQSSVLEAKGSVPSGGKVLPESRWDIGRVGISSDGTVADGSPTFASRAVLIGNPEPLGSI